MASSNQLSLPILIMTSIIISISSSPPSAYAISLPSHSTGRGRSRSLLGLKETPHGGNATFECSPSGPCLPCVYSEKNDEKYRCSGTGYHIPLKCVEIEDGSKGVITKKAQKSRSTLENPSARAKRHVTLQDTEEVSSSIFYRRLLDGSSTRVGGRQAYTTYRSCIPAVNEEKLSVLGFEVIMFCLLFASAPVIYLRRKQTVAMSGVGAVRVQTNSRY